MFKGYGRGTLLAKIQLECQLTCQFQLETSTSSLLFLCFQPFNKVKIHLPQWKLVKPMFVKQVQRFKNIYKYVQNISVGRGENTCSCQPFPDRITQCLEVEAVRSARKRRTRHRLSAGISCRATSLYASNKLPGQRNIYLNAIISGLARTEKNCKCHVYP